MIREKNVAPAIILLVAGINFSWSWSAQGRAPKTSGMEKNMSLQKKDLTLVVLAIEKELGNIGVEADLFRSKLFIYLYENPELYYQDAQQFIATTKHTAAQKTIVARAMGHLSWKLYYDFLAKLWSLCENDLISAQLFEKLAFPAYDWSTALVEHYNEPGVKSLLKAVNTSSKISANTKAYIDEDILTGNAKQDVVNLREAGQLK